MRYPSLVALIAPLAVALLPAACEKAPPPERTVIRPVRYDEAVRGGGSRVRIFSGMAQAGVESKLSFRVPGKVSRIAVRVGTEVQRGLVIAELDARDFRLQLFVLHIF